MLSKFTFSRFVAALIMIYLTTHTNLYSFLTVWGITTDNHVAIISKVSVFLSGTMLWGLLEYCFNLLEIDFNLGQFLFGVNYGKALLNENTRKPILLVGLPDDINLKKSPAWFMASNVNPNNNPSNSEDFSEFINYDLYNWDDKGFKIPMGGENTYHSFNEVKAAEWQWRSNVRNNLESSSDLTLRARMYRVIISNTSATNRARFHTEKVDYINQKFLTMRWRY